MGRETGIYDPKCQVPESLTLSEEWGPDLRSDLIVNQVGAIVAKAPQVQRSSGAFQMRFLSSGLALISVAVVIGLALWTGGWSAFAEILPGATCPPDISCLPPEPRDGVCRILRAETHHGALE